VLSYKQATCTHSRSHALAASPSLSCAYMAFCTLVHIHGFCSNTYFATWGLRSHTSMARAHTLALTLLQHHSCCLAYIWYLHTPDTYFASPTLSFALKSPLAFALKSPLAFALKSPLAFALKSRVILVHAVYEKECHSLVTSHFLVHSVNVNEKE